MGTMNAVEEGDLCAICTEPLQEHTVTLPGCGHVFHVACMLSCAQYDARCPLCRKVPLGVHLMHDTRIMTLTAPVRFTNEQALHREWRRYTARRARYFRRNPCAQAMFYELRSVRTSMTRDMDRTRQVFRRRCRDVWRDDAELVALRAGIVRLRRRERRLERALVTELERSIGPEP